MLELTPSSLRFTSVCAVLLLLIPLHLTCLLQAAAGADEGDVPERRRDVPRLPRRQPGARQWLRPLL